MLEIGIVKQLTIIFSLQERMSQEPFLLAEKSLACLELLLKDKFTLHKT